ncbi:hypothetical protein TNCV_3270851 [Trichonephila clavipes]|nr:hypothetical protein TNCV_3270851 [Trichonephila clavipes]
MRRQPAKTIRINSHSGNDAWPSEFCGSPIPRNRHCSEASMSVLYPPTYIVKRQGKASSRNRGAIYKRGQEPLSKKLHDMGRRCHGHSRLQSDAKSYGQICRPDLLSSALCEERV